MRRASTLVPVALLPVMLLLAGCSDSGDSGPEDGSATNERAAAIAAIIAAGDLAEDGELLYRQSCASCHGPAGQGGIGPQLAGVVEDKYTPETHAAVALTGRGQMPGFAASLTDEEIAAIVAYERTDLGED